MALGFRLRGSDRERFFDGLRWSEATRAADGAIHVAEGLGLPPWWTFEDTQEDLEKLAAGFFGDEPHPLGDEEGERELALMRGCPRDFLEAKVRERFLELARAADAQETAALHEAVRVAAAWGRIK